MHISGFLSIFFIFVFASTNASALTDQNVDLLAIAIVRSIERHQVEQTEHYQPQQIEEVIPNIRVPVEAFDDIIAFGFLNQYLTNTSKANAVQMEARAKRESQIMFQGHLESEIAHLPAVHPKYGFLEYRRRDNKDLDNRGFLNTSHYGEVICRIKKTLYNRMTYSLDDSLSDKIQVYPFSNLRPLAEYENENKKKDNAYVDVQVWGTLHLRKKGKDTDIEDIGIPKGLPEADKSKIISVAVDLNIPIYEYEEYLEFEYTEDNGKTIKKFQGTNADLIKLQTVDRKILSHHIVIKKTRIATSTLASVSLHPICEELLIQDFRKLNDLKKHITKVLLAEKGIAQGLPVEIENEVLKKIESSKEFLFKMIVNSELDAELRATAARVLLTEVWNNPHFAANDYNLLKKSILELSTRRELTDSFDTFQKLNEKITTFRPI